MLIIQPKGLRFKHRPTMSAFDFQIGDFTQDGAWHTKSIATIVPKNCKIAMLKMVYTAPAAGRFFGLRVTGDTYAYDTFGIVSLVAAHSMRRTFSCPSWDNRVSTTICLLPVLRWRVWSSKDGFTENTDT